MFVGHAAVSETGHEPAILLLASAATVIGVVILQNVTDVCIVQVLIPALTDRQSAAHKYLRPS